MSAAGTLPDLLAPGLAIVSVGLNPSPASVAAGFYFANPRNRFWPALLASRLCPLALQPGVAAHGILLERLGIGFTDVVKRCTRGSGDLRAADFARDAPALAGRLRRVAPTIAWFHGREAWRGFVRHGGALDWQGEPSGAPRFGLQPCRLAAARVYVSPNPSPANAAFSLADLVASYDGLTALRAGLRRTARD